MESAGKAGEYNVYVFDDSVYFEHDELGDEDALCAFIEDGRVYDYDMAFGMCDEIRAWLDDHGYNTEEILG
jgi:esterase/lipase superfamily enzyme